MKLTIHFDGSCLPKNPGGTAVGAWVLKNEDGLLAKHSDVACKGTGATNNIAEWHALRSGLQYIKEHYSDAELDIRGDSQLVIYQLNRIYQCTKPHLQAYLYDCQAILKDFTWSATWIPRNKNKEADALSKGKASPAE